MGESRTLSVLVVEDERIVALDLQQTLQRMGYDAYAIAASADEALERASERRPDVVLMDIRIKGERDGIETAALLRELFGVPVVYLTAHADDATIDRAKHTEPYGYLLKPVKSAELRSVLEVSHYKYEMERRLRERERWFSTTLRSIADGVVAVNVAGEVTFMNPAAEELTGITLDQAMARPVRDVVRLVDLLEASPLERALEGRTAVHLKEASLASVAGDSPRIISDSAAPVIDNGQLLGAVMVFKDITQQKSLQRQLESADRLASLGTMAAGVAHEVNNPLTSLLESARYAGEETRRLLEVLRARDVIDPGAEAALAHAIDANSEIVTTARRIAQIVGDLMAFSRPRQESAESGDVRQAVEWALRTTAPLLRHRARVRVEVEDPLPSVALEETKLGQVLVNLLINAAHALPVGNRDAHEVRVVARRAGEERVVVEVHDSGVGMSADVVARVFEPFFTTKGPGVGTGLGLAVCHGIVVAAGGVLRVTSHEGKGSVFTTELPARGAPPEPLRPATLVAVEQRARVLVIDDEELLLRAFKRVLRRHEVVAVRSAADALAVLEQDQRFDAILSDVMMPTMTGVQLFEAIVVRWPELASRFVFVSGGVVDAEVARFLESVPNPRLDKPFEQSQVERLLQELLASVRRN